MWDSKKIRDKQFGFTLMETLVATAIMAILACLVIPAVITIQRNLYMAKLDDYARQIFMAAQNEMSSMKDSGRLDAFAKAADGKATKIIIPSEIQSLAGLVTSVTEIAKKSETEN